MTSRPLPESPIHVLGKRIGALLGSLLLLVSSLLAADHPILVPAPHEVTWSAAAPALLKPDAVAIVLGSQVTPPEQNAARLLQDCVLERFGRRWPILSEREALPASHTLILLGQPATCGPLQALCHQQAIEVGDTSPGQDGYVIFSTTESSRLVIAIAGTNPRGVEYGQDTFAQMLRASHGTLAWVQGTIRDAPTVPWRGRPQTSVRHYLRPGELNLYVLSRINFIDLRGGIYAFPPGAELDHHEIAQAVQAAHERGLIVFGTVNCGVPAHDYPAVLTTFSQLLDLGADGLWLSFDDKGPGGDPVALTRQVLELGRQHHLGGQRIAVTPPKGSYQRITTDFNRRLMAVPGMDQALWFWTTVPSPQALQDALALGLKSRPGWWHNWPRLATQQAYVGVPSLALGWSAPDYDVLAAGSDCLDAVMPWGGNAFGQLYIVPVLGWWGWNPRAHDWNAVRHRIDALVFGEDQAAAAMQFDADLQRLFTLFHYSNKASEALPFCPPRLRQPSDRQAATALVKEMTSLLDRLTRKAPEHSSVSATELQSAYLSPMRTELQTHQAALALTYPEDWWPQHQRKLLGALYADDITAVDRLSISARDRVLTQVSQIQKTLPSFPHIQDYADWWQKRASLDSVGWQALVQSRRKALTARVREYSRQTLNTETMLAGLASPPLEWGIGRWQTQNRLLATVLPSPNEQFWGDWLAGTYQQKSIQAAVFAADRKAPGCPGEFAELQALVPLSGRHDRLALLLFASSANKDLFSNTLSPYRWAGYRFLQVLYQDKILWETDLGRLSEKGNWFLVRLPPLPATLKTLPLRLRVEDRKLSLNNYTIAYLGPIRLLELPE